MSLSKSMPKDEQLYDMRRLQTDDMIKLDLDGDGPWISPFRIAVKKITHCCCRGGTVVLRLPSTYRDPYHPVCTLTVIGSYKNVDVTASFIIYKLDSYFSGYAYHDKNKDIRDADIVWYMCKGRRVSLSWPGEEDACFAVDYDGISLSELKGQMGRETLLRALYILKVNECHLEKKEAFEAICKHFAEPLRFTDYYQIVAAGMSYEDQFIEPDELSPNYWETLSKNFVLFSREFKFRKQDYHDLERLYINNQNFRSKVNMLLMEHPEIKKEWKEKVRKAYIENFKGKTEIKVPIKRKSAVHLGGTSSRRLKKTQKELEDIKHQLEKDQNQVLEKLISSGGNPDIWINIVRALREPGDYICNLIIENSDFYVASQDLSHCFDFYGVDYIITDEDMNTLRSCVDFAGA